MKQSDNLFGNSGLPINDPFNFNNIIGIHIHYKIFFGEPMVTASVQFKNNNTEATQNFKGTNLWDIYQKVYDFCNKLAR
jgi:hypothetical protein